MKVRLTYIHYLAYNGIYKFIIVKIERNKGLHVKGAIENDGDFQIGEEVTTYGVNSNTKNDDIEGQNTYFSNANNDYSAI